MSFEDFKNIYGRLNTASALCDEYEGTLRGLQTDGVLEQILVDETGLPKEQLPPVRENSVRTWKAEFALQRLGVAQGEILNYTKTNLDEMLNSYDKKNVIRAAALGVQNYSKDESELASYLVAYRIVELLKVEEDTEDKDSRSRKRKKRLTREDREMYTKMVLPLIIKERLRNAGKLKGEALNSYAKTITSLGEFDRSYVARAINEGQELLGQRVENIGGINDYIKTNLKEDEDYFSFANSLGEAYELSEAHKKASESDAQ